MDDRSDSEESDSSGSSVVSIPNQPPAFNPAHASASLLSNTPRTGNHVFGQLVNSSKRKANSADTPTSSHPSKAAKRETSRPSEPFFTNQTLFGDDPEFDPDASESTDIDDDDQGGHGRLVLDSDLRTTGSSFGQVAVSLNPNVPMSEWRSQQDYNLQSQNTQERVLNRNPDRN